MQVATPTGGRSYDAADRPPRGRNREAFQPKAQPAPQHHSNKKAWGNMPDLRDVLEDKAKHARSIYGSRGRAPTRDDDRHAGYTKYKSSQDEYNRPDFELRRDVARHRGAAHRAL